MGKNSKLPKVNRRKALREIMLEQGAYDGRFMPKTIELKKRKKPKHKNDLFKEEDE